MRLSDERVHMICRAAVDAGLDRDTLLSGLDKRVTAQLPVRVQPGSQILSDVRELVDIGELRDGSVPLVTWLRNAIHIVWPRKEGIVFEAALRESTSHGDALSAYSPAPHGSNELGEPFVGREAEIEELNAFARAPTSVMRLVVGKPGIGKTTLLKRLEETLANDPGVCFVLRTSIHEAEAVESFAERVNVQIDQRLRSMKQGSSDRRILSENALDTALGILQHRSRSSRDRLGEVLAALPRAGAGRVALLIDPDDDLADRSYEAFFLALVKSLPDGVKMVVAQRPADVLARSHKLLALPALVTTGRSVLGELDKKRSLALLRLLLPKGKRVAKELLEAALRAYGGWPIALVAWARLDPDQRGVSPGELPSLDHLFQGMIERAGPDLRQILYAAALPPAEVDIADLARMAGGTAEETLRIVEGPGRNCFEPSLSGSGLLKLHALFRDHLRKHMQRARIEPSSIVTRLLQKLAEDCQAMYGDMDERDVLERDYVALGFAVKLSRYRPLLRRSEDLRRVAQVLLERVSAVRLGGRSYSLYSLLLLAQAGALDVEASAIEPALKSLVYVLLEDSFIHPEYGVLLLGSILARHHQRIHPEVVHVCLSKLQRVAERSRRFEDEAWLAGVAENVIVALKHGEDPLAGSDLDSLVPTSLRIGDDDDEYDWAGTAGHRVEELKRLHPEEWSENDQRLHQAYIRHVSQRSSNSV